MDKAPRDSWFKQDKTAIRGSWMPEPYQNIFIGSYPLDGATREWADQFDAVVNVSCTEGALFHPSRPTQRTYWYPVNEGGEWPFGYFFLMFKIIDFHYRKNHMIYIHCHAGAYRSPSIFRLWLVACENKTLEQAWLIERNEVPRVSKRKRKTQPVLSYKDSRYAHYGTYQSYILGNLPKRFQVFMERIRSGGIADKSFVDVLWRPVPVSRSTEIRADLPDKLKRRWWSFKYHVLRPFRRAASLYRNWKLDYIVVETSHGCTVVTQDWFKASRKRPKRIKVPVELAKDKTK
jgi:hypothetical protein